VKIGEVAKKRAFVRRQSGFTNEPACYLGRTGKAAKDGTDDVELYLTIIGYARDAGFTIAEIKVLFNGFQEDKPASARWTELAQKKWDDIEFQKKRLQYMQRLLKQSMQCRCIQLEDCGRMMLAQSRNAPEPRRVTLAAKVHRR